MTATKNTRKRFFQIMSILDESFKNEVIKNKIRFLWESDEDIDWELYEKLDELKSEILLGFFVYTHRARSGSHKSPEKIPVKEINFIDSTG